MRRIRITLSYDGTDYHGWQLQPGLPTIQSAIESVVSEIEGRPVKVEGSGRTDAGVHALAQVAAFSLENPIPPPNLEKAMNRLLPRDIRVLAVEETHENFHPRFDAIAKTYEYRILRAAICSPFERRYVHHHPYPLNEARIFEVARTLEGEHDFSRFAASDDRDALGHSKVRNLFSSHAFREGDRLIYRVRGSGFLKHMVRNIVGYLLEAGKGNIASRGPTAPARGLFLINVEYDPHRPPADPS
ncbi:MAG: tRNA pseudouridine(38-40) synthase TruA [Bryobacteraceae bacterium]